MAVNPNIASILAAGYDKIGTFAVQIVRNYQNGYGTSDKQKELKTRLIKTTKLVRILSKFVQFDASGNYVAVKLLSDTTVNDLLKYLTKVADLDNLPVAPKIFYKGYPAIRVEGGPGAAGAAGAAGPVGGGKDFSKTGLITGTREIDRFPIASARAAEWHYIVYGPGRRRGEVSTIWTDDGLTIAEPSDVTSDDIVAPTVSAVKFEVVPSGTDIVLNAVITSGTWTIEGTRYWIPGNYTPPITGVLGNGKLYIGDATDSPQQRTPAGVIAMTNAGVFSFTPGAIYNADINASAAIALSKLAPLTASRVAVTDGAGVITTSFAVATLNFISTLSSDAQGQINGKQATITGAATSVVSANLTADKILISDGAGKIAASAVSSSAIGPGGGANELQKNSGSAFTGTKVFSPSSGYLTLGDGTLAGDRTLAVSSSTANASLSIIAQGAGSAVFISPYVNIYRLSASPGGSVVSATLSSLVSSGTATIGHAVAIEFEVGITSVSAKKMGRIEVVSTNVGVGTEQADYVVSTMSAGALAERMRVTPATFYYKPISGGQVAIGAAGYDITNASGGGHVFNINSTSIGGPMVFNAGASNVSGNNGGSLFFNPGASGGGAGKHGNIAFFPGGSTGTNFQSGQFITYIGNATAAPTGNPASGGFLWVEAGALKFRGSSGTVTTIAVA